MSKEAIKYYEENRIVGDYLDKVSVVSMMDGFHRQEKAKQLILSGVSQQRELLKAYEIFVNKDAYDKLENPINKIIEKFLAFNCG